MDAAQRAMDQLEEWPDLVRAIPACGVGRALRTTDVEIVHFHSEHDADLHLTRAVILRLHPELSRSTAIRLLPGSAWVGIHLDCDDDIDLLATLTSLALQAHARVWPGPNTMPCSRCLTAATAKHHATHTRIGSRLRRRRRRTRDGA
ncbi:luciferase domain-containing protein [Streptomyces sp. NPDC001139]